MTSYSVSLASRYLLLRTVVYVGSVSHVRDARVLQVIIEA